MRSARTTGGRTRAVSGPWSKPAAEKPGSRVLLAFAVGLGAFFVYLATLAPTVATNDAGRFQIAAPVLGTGHPTGYPTFILLGKLFTYLPFGDLAYRMNLMAAFFGAVAAALFYLVAREIGGGRLPAAGGALLFAFSSTLWSQATIAEVYTMHAAFILGVTGLLLRWRRTGAGWPVLAAALLYGVSLGNNAGMVLLAPAFAVLLLAGRWRDLSPSLLAVAALEFLLGLAVYVYIPIRGFAGAWHNYGDPVRTWEDVWELVSGARFQGLMGGTPLEILEGAGRFLWYLSLQIPHPLGVALGLVLLAGGAYGARSVFLRDRAVGGALLLGLAGTLAYAISYRIDDIAVYYIPVYLFLGLFVAVGVTRLAGTRANPAPLAAVPLVLAGIALLANYGDMDRSDYYAERTRSEAIMQRLPKDAVLYGKVPVIPLTYLREVEGVREDVTLRWLDGGTLDRSFATDIESGRPVYFISDPRYNEVYLEGVEPLAASEEEDGLIRLTPR